MEHEQEKDREIEVITLDSSTESNKSEDEKKPETDVFDISEQLKSGEQTADDSAILSDDYSLTLADALLAGADDDDQERQEEVISLGSSMESDKNDDDDQKPEADNDEVLAEDIAEVISAEKKLEEAARKLAGDFGIPIGEALQDDDDEDEVTTRPKIIVPFANLGKEDVDDDDDEEVVDETICERICALSEMFPESVRSGAKLVVSGTSTGVKVFWSLSRATVWIVATTGLILAAPTMIQMELAQMEEMNRQQQRQVLLGPQAGNVSPALAQPMR